MNRTCNILVRTISVLLSVLFTAACQTTPKSKVPESWLLGSLTAPADLPLHSYEESIVLKKENILRSLAQRYLIDLAAYKKSHSDNLQQVALESQYGPLVRDAVGEHATPEELAMLTIWAHSCSPSLVNDDCLVYYEVFGGNIARLGRMKSGRAKYALWKIAQELKKSGQFDGHYSEELEEAADAQDR